MLCSFARGNDGSSQSCVNVINTGLFPANIGLRQSSADGSVETGIPLRHNGRQNIGRVKLE
jgi:hypothetical protein